MVKMGGVGTGTVGANRPSCQAVLFTRLAHPITHPRIRLPMPLDRSLQLRELSTEVERAIDAVDEELSSISGLPSSAAVMGGVPRGGGASLLVAAADRAALDAARAGEVRAVPALRNLAACPPPPPPQPPPPPPSLPHGLYFGPGAGGIDTPGSSAAAAAAFNATYRAAACL